MMGASFDLAPEVGTAVMVGIRDVEVDVRVTSTEPDPKEEYSVIVEVPIEVMVVEEYVSPLGGIGDVVPTALFATALGVA
jgi:hypothetical protein